MKYHGVYLSRSELEPKCPNWRLLIALLTGDYSLFLRGFQFWLVHMLEILGSVSHTLYTSYSLLQFGKNWRLSERIKYLIILNTILSKPALSCMIFRGGSFPCCLDTFLLLGDLCYFLTHWIFQKPVAQL